MMLMGLALGQPIYLSAPKTLNITSHVALPFADVLKEAKTSLILAHIAPLQHPSLYCSENLVQALLLSVT
jgi:hypothetical protein